MGTVEHLEPESSGRVLEREARQPFIELYSMAFYRQGLGRQMEIILVADSL
jgi:hypothetical protein